MARIEFNANEHEPVQNEPIPAGWYHCTIVESELVSHPDDKPEQGDHLKIAFEVDENEHPAHANRRVYLRLYINHNSEKARKMALGNLSSLCRALDMLQLDDTDELLGAKLQVKVSIRVDKNGQYEPQNEAKGFKPAGAATPAEAPPAAQAKTAPPAAGKPAQKKGNW